MSAQQERVTQLTMQRAVLFRSIGEVMAQPTQVRWLLPSILEQNVIALLAGPRGTYKSFIALHWLLTLAVRRTPVFLVSAEGAGLDRRAEAWLKVHAPSVAAGSLPFYVHEQRVDFNDPAGLACVADAIVDSTMEPKVLVIDTFSKNSGTLDENSNVEVKDFIGRLDTGLRARFDLTILLIAHTGHGDKSRVRGASALEADTDAAFIVSRKGVERVVTVVRNRFKDAAELPPLVYQAEVVDLGRYDEAGQPVTSIVMREEEDGTPNSVALMPTGKAQRAIFRALLSQQKDSAIKLIWTPEEMRRIGRHLGQGKSTAHDAVIGLMTSGCLTQTVGGHYLADGVQ